MASNIYKTTRPLTIFLLLSITNTTVIANTSLEAAYSQSTSNKKSYAKTAQGCKVYHPPLSFGNRVTWSGNCSSGYAQGEGIAKWYNGNEHTSSYQGNYVEGKLNGKGRIDWEIITNCDFDYYEGELKDSDVMGRGIFHYTDGNIYDGVFTPKGKPTKAVFTWGAGNESYSDRYEGEFLNGKKQGKGVYSWGEYSQWAGDVYEGEYKNNKQHGYGVYTEGNGTRYEGQWKNNQRSGYGEIVQSDGTIYKGEWKNDLRDGNGEITWSDDRRYEGQHLEGQLHGQGKLYSDNELLYEGQFAYGQLSGQGKITYSDGGWAEGNFSQDKLSGEGINVRANGIRYAGSFQDGKAWGFGHLTAPRAAFDIDKRAKNGVWQGDTFVEKGWFYDNKFKFPCDSTEHCKRIAAKDATKQAYLANSDDYSE